ncbi:hypothetical protein [Lactobacillus ultunensis]|uniref:hypothetical protein n=2 Tax=Lactobacillus ultunensis TaxID=227945 RepID=UPI00019CF3E7|nr:hypothetical protein [Lactobacillus ultunensis]KRL81615.1 hypothetical protein FC57_GL000485 [Lactobacillus ultunensis DSM 16047]QQP28642.1 hypothetical protein H4B44_00575 [Lactobacillus ultunensis]
MNKRTKLISLAAVALLTVAPTLASTVQADTTSTQQSTTTTTTNTQTTNTTATATTPVATTPISVDFTLNGETHTVSPDGLYFQVAPNSTFNPTDFTGTSGVEFKLTGAKGMKVTVDSNSVDTSKAGSTGVVKLTATDAAGKATSISYTVFVKPEGLFQLNLPMNYALGLGDTDTVYQGEQYYITNNVKFARGEFFTGISKQSQNASATSNSVKWIATKYLANSKTQFQMLKLRQLP